MSTVHFRDARIFVDGFDLSANHNNVSVEMKVDVLDQTTFGYVTRIHRGGLTDIGITGKGFWDPTPAFVDRVMFALVGVDDKVATLFPNGITEGAQQGFASKGVLEHYNVSGEVGSLLNFDMAFQGRGIDAVG